MLRCSFASWTFFFLSNILSNVFRTWLLLSQMTAALEEVHLFHWCGSSVGVNPVIKQTLILLHFIILLCIKVHVPGLVQGSVISVSSWSFRAASLHVVLHMYICRYICAYIQHMYLLWEFQRQVRFCGRVRTRSCSSLYVASWTSALCCRHPAATVCGSDPTVNFVRATDRGLSNLLHRQEYH